MHVTMRTPQQIDQPARLGDTGISFHLHGGMPLDNVIGCSSAEHKEDPASDDNACNGASTELVALLYHAILGGDSRLRVQGSLAVVEGPSAISANLIGTCRINMVFTCPHPLIMEVPGYPGELTVCTSNALSWRRRPNEVSRDLWPDMKGILLRLDQGS